LDFYRGNFPPIKKQPVKEFFKGIDFEKPGDCFFIQADGPGTEG
jgi:hypothetical protein